MSWQKSGEKNIRKLSKTTRGGYLVRLPIDFVKKLRWRDGQKLDLSIDEKRGKIVVRDWEGDKKNKK